MRDAVVAASLNFFSVEIRFFHDEKIVDEYTCQKNEEDLDLILGKFKRMMRRVA